MSHDQVSNSKPTTKEIIIAIDFDGTIVKHQFPEVGPIVPYALKVLKKLSAIPQVKLMLWTMRSTTLIKNRDCLQEAHDFLKSHNLNFNLDWINQNPNQNWSSSNKQFADIYIDDAALGTPLVRFSSEERSVVDWKQIELLIMTNTNHNLLNALYACPTIHSGTDLIDLLEDGLAYATYEDYVATYVKSYIDASSSSEQYFYSSALSSFYSEKGITFSKDELINKESEEGSILIRERYKSGPVSKELKEKLLTKDWRIHELLITEKLHLTKVC